MEPIISPWFIYFLGIANGVSIFFQVASVVSGLCVAGGLAVVCWGGESGEEVVIKQGLRFSLKMAFLFIPILLITFLLPNRNTLIGMAVAQNVTPDRIVIAGKKAVEFKDMLKKDVLDIIEAAQKKDIEK